MTDPNGPAFEAALKALKKGLRRQAGGHRLRRHASASSARWPNCSAAPRPCSLGIEDPQANAHAPNESLHEGDFRKLTASIAHLFDNLGNLPDGKVK